MPIKIEFDPTGQSLFGSVATYTPVAVCDICGERIENARSASYLFDKSRGPLTKRTVLDTEIIFAHNAQCLRVAEARFPSFSPQELRWFIGFFEKNMQLDGDQGR
jgi:hypothetical protein